MRVPRIAFVVPGLVLAASLLIAGCAGNASAGTAAAPATGSQTGIFVNGVGIVKIKPDVAKIRLGVQTTAESAQSAQSQAATQMDKVIAALKASGLRDEDIKTVEYSLYPYQNYVSGRETEKGYRATNIVAVTLKDVNKVGQILDAASAAGANRMDSITFDSSNPADAQAKARELAMADAKEKAQALAKAGGVVLGKPVSISESSVTPVVPRTLSAGDMAKAASATTPITSGEMEVTVSVTVQYGIE